MADANLAVPRPESGDVDDVVLGLETAATLWKRGDAQDAIRWLRRAAEAAEEAGNDMRALALARAAADLTTAQEEDEVTPVPAVVAVRPASPQPVLQPSSPQPASRPSGPRPASQPSSPKPDLQSSPKLQPAPAPSSPGSSTTAAKVDVAPASASRPPTPPGGGAAAVAKPAKRGGGAMDALSELASLARSDGAMATRSRPTSPTALRGIRVALSRSKEQPGMLLARVLDDDEIAERGEKNGMVIATEVIVEQLMKPR